jgi:hypothetical protein
MIALVSLIMLDISHLRDSEYYRKSIAGSYWSYEWDHLFAEDKCGSSECLGVLLFTAPALGMVAYWIGAVFGFYLPKQPESPDTVASR